MSLSEAPASIHFASRAAVASLGLHHSHHVLEPQVRQPLNHGATIGRGSATNSLRRKTVDESPCLANDRKLDSLLITG